MRGPQRPYKSIRDMRERVLFGSNRFFDEHHDKWPCFACRGNGRIYDPADPPCPIEGNKMRDVIMCSDCGGTRCIPFKEFKAAYSQAINKYKEEKARYQGLVKTRRIALKKLTSEECQALKALGIP